MTSGKACTAPPGLEAARRAEHVRNGVARRRALVVCLLRHYLETTLEVGAPFPPAKVLAADLDLHEHDVAYALAALDQAGEIVYAGAGRGRSWRLAPGERHPDDVAFDTAVRAAVLDGRHQPGAALPTTLLARRHQLHEDLVPRAARHLVRDGLVAWLDGPAGHGLYVQPPPYGPQTAPTGS
ncbi:hypothetical protein [Streptomyces sp. NPDC091278]|uniref:hypothetical protein n=1 Tax=Streptomyces sp. NPDC091278 TaxID=3155301 RepID=UPI00344CE50C